MKITRIRYTIRNKFSYEDYETITIDAAIDNGEDITQVYQDIKSQCDRLRREKLEDLDRELREKRREVMELDRNIQNSISKWDQLRNFYATQGIKELDGIPAFKNLLPPVIQGEIVDEKKSMTFPSDEF